MGLATLNVWIHDKTDPCRIDDGIFWFVNVTYCNGKPVEWCGHHIFRRVSQVRPCRISTSARVLRGPRDSGALVPPKPPLFTVTDHAIVIVGCDEKACVHLYTPTDRQRTGSAALGARFLVETEGLPREKVDRFVAASDALLEDMPKTSRDVTLNCWRLADTFKKNPPEGSGSTK